MQGTQKPAEEVALVAVIGASASGKSSFINAIMGPVAEVGSGNSSCTDELAKWTYDLPDGRKVTFVDTPGLNFYSETGIDRPAETTLKKLDELSSSINFPAQYLFVVHNISEDCPLQPLRYGSNRRFNSLCSRTQVHVITTHWDEVLEDEDEDPSVYEQVVAEKEELLFSEKSFLEYVRSVSPNAPLHRSGFWNQNIVPPTDYVSPKDLIFHLFGVPGAESEDQMEAQLAAEDPSPPLPDKPTEPVVVGNNRVLVETIVAEDSSPTHDEVLVEPSARSDEALAVLQELRAHASQLAELSSSMKDHHSLARDHTQHLADITSTMKDHQSFTSTVHLLSEERDKAKEECSGLLKEVADLQAERTKLAASFSSSVQVLSEERDKAKAATSRLAEDFAALQAEKANVTHLLATSDASLAEERKKLEESKAVSRRLAEDFATLRAEKGEVARLLATSDAALAEQTKKLEESKADSRQLSENLAALQIEKENVARLLVMSDAALEDKTGKMNQAKAESIRLAEELEAAQSEKENIARMLAKSHAALSEKAKEVEDVTAGRDSLERNIRDLKHTLSTTSSEHSACSGKILALQRDLKTAEMRSRRGGKSASSQAAQAKALYEAENALAERTKEFEKRVADLESELKASAVLVEEERARHSQELSKVQAEKEALEERLADQELFNSDAAPYETLDDDGYWDEIPSRKKLGGKGNGKAFRGSLKVSGARRHD
ncbi:hypothetical protein D9611_011420 [Ephemerocybe angulata]|uniref:G domain-containing protein n=1 Tax=Ephemerocybe angulata TaxID=980116 RepID=A0A8H5FK47_9AGAR|nr:hypothetical protein D9611_011420 [Tulosesus angulatus]